MPNIPVTVGFGGGAEFLFDNKRSYAVSLPERDKQCKRILGDLIFWIKDNLLKERPELFVQGDSVRPGILVLVNETDWELVDTINYQIQPNDNILFISTLHGG